MVEKVLGKQWVIFNPIQAMEWTTPTPLDFPWSRDTGGNTAKLLRAKGYNLNSINVDMNADIYFFISGTSELMGKELSLIKMLKKLNKKIVLLFPHDYRFLTGDGLRSSDGVLYTDLCKEADLILSGLPNNFNMFGRYEHKVLSVGIFLERLNFSEVFYEDRHIDLLLSGPYSEDCFSFSVEIMRMVKEKYPDKRIVYSIGEIHNKMTKSFPDIEFSNKNIIDLLPYSRVYLNPEVRPRAGRAIVEAWYCRTPFISCKNSYHSNIFPELAYNRIDFNFILQKYEKMVYYNYDEVIKEAELRVEDDYFDNCIYKIMERLYPLEDFSNKKIYD